MCITNGNWIDVGEEEGGSRKESKSFHKEMLKDILSKDFVLFSMTFIFLYYRNYTIGPNFGEIDAGVLYASTFSLYLYSHQDSVIFLYSNWYPIVVGLFRSFSCHFSREWFSFFSIFIFLIIVEFIQFF